MKKSEYRGYPDNPLATRTYVDTTPTKKGVVSDDEENIPLSEPSLKERGTEPIADIADELDTEKSIEAGYLDKEAQGRAYFKFESFLGNLKNNTNAPLIESIKKGFRACYEAQFSDLKVGDKFVDNGNNCTWKVTEKDKDGSVMAVRTPEHPHDYNEKYFDGSASLEDKDCKVVR